METGVVEGKVMPYFPPNFDFLESDNSLVPETDLVVGLTGIAVVSKQLIGILSVDAGM